MKNKAFLRRASILAMVLLAFVFSVPLIPQAHAGGITFKGFCHNNTSGTTINCGLAGVATGDTVVVNVFGIGSIGAGAFTTTDSQSNTYGAALVSSVTASGGGASTYVFATLSTASGGTDTITVAVTPARIYGFTATDYSGVSGFGKTGTDQQDGVGNTGSTSVSLTGTSASSLFIDDFGFAGSAPIASLTSTNGQTTRDAGDNANCIQSSGQCRVADSAAPVLSWSWSGTCGPCSSSHSVLELTGGSSSSFATVTQCYGNCGNPPITLVNTNSTHTTNFNRTITLLYEFQSNVNGFILNVTTNLANNYFGNMFLAVYEIPTCNLGQTPFSGACPGQLRQSQSQLAIKGRNPMTISSLPVAAGQWVGISITATSSGLDINDTNTAIPLFQTNEGNNPPTIQAAALLTNSKMAVWAWIRGNVVTGTGPPPGTPGCVGSFAGFLDCILPNWVASLCGNPTAACLNSSGLIWAFGLAMFFTFFTMRGSGEITPNLKLPFGEVFMAWALVWIFVLTGIGQLFAWVPIFIFFIVSLIYGKNVGRYL